MNILHLDSSILGDGSVTRQLGAALVERLRETRPDATLIYRDLADIPLQHLSGAHMAVRMGAGLPEDAALAADIARGDAMLDEFLAADTIVIGAPMYNFGLSTQLKAWIDRIAVAGKTFSYTANGPIGLAAGKTVYILSGRGSAYAPGTPIAALDHQESHLRAIFGLMGIETLHIIRAEGVAVAAGRDAAMADALGQIAARDLDADIGKTLQAA